MIFLITVLYYGYPYIQKAVTPTNNPRTNWYIRNYSLMCWNQIIITAILVITVFLFCRQFGEVLSDLSATDWSLIFVFPVAGALYYGANFFYRKFSLRKIGWLKPFVIGFTWAGLVTIYPVLFYKMVNHLDYQFRWASILLFIKNFMFISVLCIMFDIKDYTADYLARLKTLVVKMGSRKTIFYIVLPLSVLGLFSFVLYAETHQFNRVKLLLNVIPFLLLIAVAWSLRKRRSLLYYLCIVDGLMLAKAVFGCIAMKYF
jgi:4-hydroxybenzoate polyprenyltransferase